MKVKIKDWHSMMEEFGLDENGDINCNCGFVSDMKERCGEIIEVDEIIFVEGAFAYFKYDYWTFTDDMYEVIEE